MREQGSGGALEQGDGGDGEDGEDGERERIFPNYQLPITNYQLPITNYQLAISRICTYSTENRYNQGLPFPESSTIGNVKLKILNS